MIPETLKWPLYLRLSRRRQSGALQELSTQTLETALGFEQGGLVRRRYRAPSLINGRTASPFGLCQMPRPYRSYARYWRLARRGMLMSGGVMIDALFILGQILSIAALCCGAWLTYVNRHLWRDSETKSQLAQYDRGLAPDRREVMGLRTYPRGGAERSMPHDRSMAS